MGDIHNIHNIITSYQANKWIQWPLNENNNNKKNISYYVYWIWVVLRTPKLTVQYVSKGSTANLMVIRCSLGSFECFECLIVRVTKELRRKQLVFSIGTKHIWCFVAWNWGGSHVHSRRDLFDPFPKPAIEYPNPAKTRKNCSLYFYYWYFY